MKKIFSILAMIALITVVIVACKDNFNESDFLNLQNKLKTSQDTAKLNQQIKQLNAAGALLSFTVQVVEDRTPLQGVDVTISNSTSAGSVKVTTDANGNAVFPNVVVGNNTIILNKTGYISTTAVVDFGALSNFYQTVPGANGTTNIVALKQSRSCILPLFATGGTGSTATISGKVTIENDLTNSTPEIPQNITLKANITSTLTAAVVQPTTVNVQAYSFNSGFIGTAAVDNTTGNYSMTVPATASGLTMSLIIPEIEGTQKIAANTIYGQPANGLAAPQTFPAAMLNIPTQWGDIVSSSAGYDASIPTVPSAKAVFSSPPAPGAGLSFTMASLSRPLGVASDGVTAFTWDTYNSGINASDPTQFDIGQTAYQLLTRGSGYTASPTVTPTGGGGTGAVMRASLRGILTGLAVSAGGTAYTGANVTATFSYVDNNTVQHDMIFPSCAVTVSSGALATITLPTSGLTWQTAASGSTGFNVASFKVTISGGGGTGATATATYLSEVDAIKLENAGTGYTSAPSIAFTGGGGTTQATMTVNEFRTQWSVALNNTTNTTAYSILPNNITWQYMTLNGGIFTDGQVYDRVNNSSFFNNDIKANGGQVIQLDPTNSYRTLKFSKTQPVAVITSSQSIQATANVGLTNGIVTSLTGAVAGKGYSTPPTVTIQPMVTGATGSGATVDISGNINYNTITGEYTWTTGYTITNGGSGYVTNVNQQAPAQVNFAPASTSISVKTGQTYVQNILYGTGKRKSTLN